MSDLSPEEVAVKERGGLNRGKGGKNGDLG